jgi:hypothetical protein
MNDEILRKLVNSSGFLFQLRVEDEIRRECRKWRVVETEHPWKDAESGKEGYADIIIASGALRGVIECKRAIDGLWVFLIPDQDRKNVLEWRSLWVNGEKAGLNNFYADPQTPESEFCVVRGAEKEMPLLERYTDSLINACEGIAAEEMEIYKNRPEPIVYVPIIVTTSALWVCELSPEKISLTEGKIPDDHGAFSEVPYIRFRKSLGPFLDLSALPRDLQESHALRERTVFVVNSISLIDFLEGFEDNARSFSRFHFGD